MAKKPKLEKTMKRRYTTQSVLGSFSVRDQQVGRIICICTRRSDALLIVKAINRT